MKMKCINSLKIMPLENPMLLLMVVATASVLVSVGVSATVQCPDKEFTCPDRQTCCKLGRGMG